MALVLWKRIRKPYVITMTYVYEELFEESFRDRKDTRDATDTEEIRGRVN